jgi:hypothetical protein
MSRSLHGHWRLALCGLVFSVPWQASATPLTLYEIDSMPLVLECHAACNAGSVAAQADCIAGCPELDANWEKTSQAPIDMQDFDLAVLEYWDEAAGTYICYENDAVVAAPACGLGDCLSSHTQEECADSDGDGIPAWQEETAGLSDAEAQPACAAHADCSFVTGCSFVFELSRHVCLPRTCDGDLCTAFHLETVAEDNQEVILYVHYDYSPVPATILDLRLTYSDTDLTLIDARPLPPLIERGKELAVTHPSAGQLRLVVLGPGSSLPIPTGAIVELVFQRASSLQSNIAFHNADFYQRNSMAPSQGQAAAELETDALWGSSIQLAQASSTGPRLVLSYPFDNPLQPMSVNNAPAASDLCDLVGQTVCPPADAKDHAELELRAKTLAKLEVLQAGITQASQSIEGMSASGAYLDGSSDHLQLPIILNNELKTGEQDFSLAMWFYSEGTALTDAEMEQLLFSNNSSSEKTRFGLMLEEETTTTATLTWIEGEYGSGSETRTPLVTGLPLLTWTHLGLTVDADAGDAHVFVNGQLIANLSITATPVIGCPQLGTTAVTNPAVVLHEEGRITGGRPPEVLFFASAQNNLYGVERMDLTGLNRRDVVRATDAIHQDPDFNAGVGKLVYSSNTSGSFEIWIADSNGDNPQRITNGFGDTARGVFARRPRWAPDASAIIFESNAYNLASSDNAKQVYHLYYIAYDNRANEVAVPLESGNTTTELDYTARVLDETIANYRITALGNKNHNQVMWLDGKATDQLGQILFNVSNQLFDEPRVRLLTIPDPKNSTDSGGELPFPELPDSDGFRALAAQDISPGGTRKAKLLLERAWQALESQDLFEWSASTDEEGTTRISITRTASGTDPVEVRGLHLYYDATVVTPDLEASGAGGGIGDGDTQIAKQVGLRAAELASGSHIRIEVLSPSNNTPLAVGTEIATVVFRAAVADGEPAFSLVDLVAHRALYIKDLADESNPPALLLSLTGARIERVTEAVFGPNGDWLMFEAISAARPVLMKAKLVVPDDLTVSGAVYALTDVQRVSPLSANVKGLSWKKQERFYACNWIGGYRDPYSKLYHAGLRGGLDDVRVYSYVRGARAFLSDAERGFARLSAEGRSAEVDSLVPECAGLDTECPPYYQCVGGQCEMVACDPLESDGCDNGQCSLRPVSVEASDSRFDWVCATDCSSDIECQQQDCLNGPCRFCNAGLCTECTTRTDDFGSFQLTYPQGCPDRNSFTCDAGSCLTECYSFENGESRYLCDPALEYCHLGRCEVFEWSWSELSPASLAGLGETRFDLTGMSYTVAQPQLYPIVINAYGVEDYLHSPEIMVEGKVETDGQQVYDGAWFEIGRVLVHNRTEAEADERAFKLVTQQPITALRVRLVTPPVENLNAAATGLGSRDAAHCWKRAEDWAEESGTQPDYRPCYRRASGSRATLGYRAGIPIWEAYAACDARGVEGCKGQLGDDPHRHFLHGGQPAVVITNIRFNGGSVLANTSSNTICSYEGDDAPMEGRRPKKVVFGDAVLEQSNQRSMICGASEPPDWCDTANLVDRVAGEPATLPGGVGVLNCNYLNPYDPLEDVAALTVPLGGEPAESALADSNITETANGCRFTDTGGAEHSCYEVIGGEASMDPFNSPSDIYHTLDIDQFQGFSYSNDLVTAEDTE